MEDEFRKEIRECNDKEKLRALALKYYELWEKQYPKVRQFEELIYLFKDALNIRECYHNDD